MKLFDDNEYETSEEMTDAWEMFSYDLKEALDSSDDVYVIYGSFGRWDGPVMGGAIIKSYDDLIRFLSFRGEHWETFSDDKGEFKVDQVHHDGSNHYTMRKLTRKGLDRYRNHMGNVGKVDAELLRSLMGVRFYTKKAQIAKAMRYA